MDFAPSTFQDFIAVAPLLVVAFGSLVVLLAGAVRRDDDGQTSRPLTLAVLALAGVCYLPALSVEHAPQFSGMVNMNAFSAVCGLAVVLAGIVVTLLSRDYLKPNGIAATEYYGLLLPALLGMQVLSASTDLVSILVSVELLSICLYAMVGLERSNPRSLEAAMKYFLLGSFASAFLVFGIAFVFGATAQTNLTAINLAVARGDYVPEFMVVGFAMLVVGFGFKLALAPFHMWAPDVYQGAPTPITALVATASKVAGFAAALQVVLGLQTFLANSPTAVNVLVGVAGISMLVGNVLGIVQTGIKRMLAYSSIAHSGYIAIALLAVARGGGQGDTLHAASGAIVYYLVGYTFMNLLAFGVASVLGRKGDTKLENYRGLSQRDPGMAALMAVAMLALTGTPLTAGFVGKYLLFGAGVQQGFILLAVIGILSTVLSAYYYLRVLVLMYFHEPNDEAAWPAIPLHNRLPLIACAAVVVLMGVLPAVVWPLVSAAARGIAGGQ